MCKVLFVNKHANVFLLKLGYYILPFMLQLTEHPYIKWLENVGVWWEAVEQDPILITNFDTSKSICEEWPSRIRQTGRVGRIC